uniref:NADH-ubiquinone oxidoreductase chain 4L n=1 Tax=Cucujoidea sp. 42 KM-2017 TaxID=2219381 RepID=A0A346RJ10_9CUCU|nr:NADH dehydrogenase subunit 4L [Cucujoidea sp. 42 KM-2017]
MEMYFMIFLFIFSILMFSLNRKHFLMMLLSMEFVVLILFMFLFLYLMSLSFESYFSMIFLSLSVCESALGLSLLVSMVRFYGNDNFSSFNILW